MTDAHDEPDDPRNPDTAPLPVVGPVRERLRAWAMLLIGGPVLVALLALGAGAGGFAGWMSLSGSTSRATPHLTVPPAAPAMPVPVAGAPIVPAAPPPPTPGTTTEAAAPTTTTDPPTATDDDETSTRPSRTSAVRTTADRPSRPASSTTARPSRPSAPRPTASVSPTASPAPSRPAEPAPTSASVSTVPTHAPPGQN